MSATSATSSAGGETVQCDRDEYEMNLESARAGWARVWSGFDEGDELYIGDPDGLEVVVAWEEVVHYLDVLARIRVACGLGPDATRAAVALVTFREASLDPHMEDPLSPFEYDRETAERMTRVTLEYAGLIDDALADATRARSDVARHDSRGSLCTRLQELRSREWRERAEELRRQAGVEERMQLDADEYDEEVLDSFLADEVEASELATAIWEDPPAALERLRTRPRLRRLGDFPARERELREVVEACAAP